MQQLTRDLIDALQLIKEAGGTISPTLTPASDSGYEYAVNGQVLRQHDLERLAETDYLDRVFQDRLSHCPQCGSHAINMREICTVCKSAHIGAVELIHHLRCGYVAPAYEFTPEAEGRRCPKCHRLLIDRGTDHEVPGPHFVCQECYVSFQMPEMGGLCLSCGGYTNGSDLGKIIYEDFYTYKLSTMGAAALRSGTGVMLDDVHELALPLLRRSMFMAFLEDEQKRHRRFKAPFSVLLVSGRRPEGASAATEQELLEAMQARLSETDKIGRYDERHYLILLPGTEQNKAERVVESLVDRSEKAFSDWDTKATVLRSPTDGVSISGMISSAITPAHA